MIFADRAESQAAADRCLKTLMEHFEAVQILCTRVTPEGTEHYFVGNGNWYARQGMADEFREQDIGQTHASQLAKQLPQDPPDEGEEWKQT